MRRPLILRIGMLARTMDGMTAPWPLDLTQLRGFAEPDWAK
jgi:hypothetical protein